MVEIGDLEPQGGAKQTAEDLFSGAMGGIAQVLIGQPFDIVKVRLQTTTNYTGAFDCAAKIWQLEGPSAFYKGTLTPLIGIGACVSVQFGGFHFARRAFEARNATKALPGTGSSEEASPLSLPQYYTAGAFAGVVNSVLSGPIEHVRIRLQTQPHAASRAQMLYASPLSCIRTLISRGGVANGLYRGQVVTILREAQAYGCWFLTYEYLMAREVARLGLKGRQEVEAWRLAFYGGLAGEVLWLSSYPFDVVKSKMQTDGLDIHRPRTLPVQLHDKGTNEAAAKETVAKQFGTRQFKNMRDCFAQTWRQEGLRGFWKGIGPTLVRAMPVSGATFFVAEMTMRLISEPLA